MDIRHISTFRRENFGSHPLRCGYNLCGDESDYGLLRRSYPKDVAEHIVRAVFSDKEIEEREFVYEPRYYRGRNNLQDTVTVYYKEKKQTRRNYEEFKRDNDCR